ncbi:hypothetical protein [Hydromonas duriensis]|nr:hypothetical protein [Hydromonas duriensis]
MSQVWLHIIGIFALVFFGVLVLILIWQTNGAKQWRLLNAAQQHYDNSEALRAMTHKMNEEARLQLQEANQTLMDLYASIKNAEEELLLLLE